VTDQKVHVTTTARPHSPASGQRTSLPRFGPGLLWLGPGLLSLALCLYHAGRPQLWRDEFASVSAATRGLGGLFSLLGNVDASTGLYYLLLHVWISVAGSSPTALRLPSALAMAGAAILVARIGARLYGAASGLAGGLVFALVPAVSRYGQETRAYALAAFAVALATLLLLRALERPGRARWAAYAAAIVLVAAAHIVALSCLAGHAVAVALQWRRDRRTGPVLGFAAAVGAALVLAAPLIAFAHGQVGDQLSWLAPPDLADPVHVVLALWIDLFASRAGAALGALLVVLGLLLPLLRRRRRAATLFLLASGVLPPLAIAVFSQSGTSYFLARYLLFTDLAWSVLAGAGLVGAVSALAGRVRAARADRARALPVYAVAAAAVAATALGLLAVWPDQTGVRAYGSHEWTNYPRGTDPGYIAYQGSAEVLARHARSGDGIVYLTYPADMVNLGVGYYLGRTGSRVDLDPVFQVRSPQQNDGYLPTLCPDSASCLASAPHRIWVVEQQPRWYGSAAQNTERRQLNQDYAVAATYHLSQVDVELLVRKD
jgi:mannosyltransferase